MLRDRGSDGRQVPNAEKFPGGWPAVTSAIHALGMMSGLYTSKSEYTCAGFNASCGKETIDAAAYAEWGIDMIKEDSCELSKRAAGRVRMRDWMAAPLSRAQCMPPRPPLHLRPSAQAALAATMIRLIT